MSAELTTAEFDDKVAVSDLPVLIDFWAEWCGPCKAISPIIDELAKDFEGRLRVFKVNIDTEGELAVRFGVMSIPTLLILQNGEELDRMTGAAPKPSIARFIEKHL